MAFQPYGEEYVKHRKIFQQAFSRQGVFPFRSIQLHQTHVLLQNLLRDPERHVEHTGRYANLPDLCDVVLTMHIPASRLQSSWRLPMGIESSPTTILILVLQRRSTIY